MSSGAEADLVRAMEVDEITAIRKEECTAGRE
jgi:hypothetical protein